MVIFCLAIGIRTSMSLITPEATLNSRSLAGLLAVMLFDLVAVAEAADGPTAIDLQRPLESGLDHGELILDIRCAFPCARASRKAIPCR